MYPRIKRDMSSNEHSMEDMFPSKQYQLNNIDDKDVDDKNADAKDR